MIFKIVIMLAIFTTAMASPLSRVSISGFLPTGPAFSAFGNTVAGASSDGNGGIAASGLEGFGSVLGIVTNGQGLAAAIQSPSF